MATTDTLAKPDIDRAGESDRSGIFHYVDLVLGGWRPREAAFQLAAGLGVTLRRLEHVDPADDQLATKVEAVDFAAKGDPLVNQAWEDATRIAAALPVGAAVVVLAPQFDLPLRAENEWFFSFLRRLDRTVVIVGQEPAMRAVDKSPFEVWRSVVVPTCEVDRDAIGPEGLQLLGLFPGLLPRELAEAADLAREDTTLIPIGKDHFLVPISYRDKDPRKCAFDFDGLESVEGEDEGFKAISQSYCTSHFADAAALTDLGLRYYRVGSRDIGRDLVARARSVSRDPASVARTELALLEMDLFERRFADIVAVPRLSQRAPAANHERLGRLKEWARLGIGDLSGVSEFIGASLRRLSAENPIDAGDILWLDQVVRARLAAGDFNGAITAGRSVASALAHAGGETDQRLVYANAISLTQVYTARGDLAALGREIDRAFATCIGVRSSSDILLMNFLRARAEADQTSEAAAACWLKAALTWLCHEPRAGLGRDAVEAILGVERAARPRVDDDMSAALADGLAGSWPDIASAPSGRTLVTGPIFSNAPRRLYGGPGVAVLWSPETVAAPSPSPPRGRLAQLACAALGKICPPFVSLEHGTISIDTNLGVDIPGTRDEALLAALRLGTEEVYYGDERINLDTAMRKRLTAELEVRLSPIVRSAADVGDGLVVTFKRYLPRTVLFDDDAQLVGPLKDGDRIRLHALPMIAEGQTPESVESRIRRLEAARIVRLAARPK